jgi:two-component system, OmpR family, phosphate regulon sensor histidine kinase PhoR
LAEQSGVRLHATLTASPVFSSSEPVRQVIGNLLTNAIRYNKPNGEVRISTQEDRPAILSVTDTGIGIPSADLPFIFDRF